MGKSKIQELVCVYHGSKGILGQAGALLGKQIFINPCALALLTTDHMQPRAQWLAFVEKLPVPVTYLHADTKVRDLFYIIRGHTPCIVARCDHNQSILLLGSGDLQHCHGSIEVLQQSLSTAINAKFLTF